MISSRTLQVAAVILAAGESSRIGCPKQLLIYEGKSLLSRSIESARHAGCTEVIVVLGANAAMILNSLGTAAGDGKFSVDVEMGGVSFALNPNWNEGQGSSIVTGIDQVQRKSDAVLIMLCDQPLITPDDLRNLMFECRSSTIGIAAASYGGTLGAPACFSRTHFAELQKLRGDRGAKHLLRTYSQEISQVEMEHASLDIDTTADYARLAAPGGLDES